LQRLAEDGSQKLVTTMRECAIANAKDGRSVQCFALVVATWIRYLVGVDEQGETIPITDPRSAELTALAREILSCPDGALPVTAPSEPPVKFLQAVFGEELASNSSITTTVHETLVELVATSSHELMTKICSNP
jgi:fructuronate reductase